MHYVTDSADGTGLGVSIVRRAVGHYGPAVFAVFDRKSMHGCSVERRSRHLQVKGFQARNGAHQGIACHHSRYALGCAGVDEVAWLQFPRR